MSDLNLGATENAEAPRSRDLVRTILMIVVPILIFVAGAATAIVGQRVLLGSAADEMRILAFEDWRVVCPPVSDQTDCELSSNPVPGQVSLVVDDPTLGSRLRVIVPHGVFLDPGLGFSIGDQPLQVYQFETCVQTGCFALVTIDTATLELLQNNMNGEVVVVPAAGTPVTVPYTLNGFSEGFDALVEERARRDSMWGFLAG
ncbi:MAG: invasion associated locus B family protein [Alphaproteobacteria bacterium]|jgi:invasion protein IalB